MSVYGYCPSCGAPGSQRTRGIPCYDICTRGHRYLANTALLQPLAVTNGQPANDQKTRYVEGLLFTENRRQVVLVRKADDCKIPRLRGKVCGLGGKIEDGESPRLAMAREFHEEAGVLVPVENWQHYATLSGPDFEVLFFRAFDTVAAYRAHTVEDKGEAIGIYNTETYLRFPVAANLPVMMTLALDRSGIVVPVVMQDERSQAA